MSQRTNPSTAASTAGLLPDTAGIVLLAVVVGTVLVFGSLLGYALTPISLILASGVVAGLGVRVAATDRSRYLVVGVTVLWLAALTFTAGTIRLVLTQSQSGLIASLFASVVAAAALLGPFGVVSNTIRMYGHGAGGQVLRRYFIGTVILGLLVGGLSTLSLLQVVGVGFFIAPLPGAGDLLTLRNSLSARVTAAVIVYTAALFTVPWAVRSFPIEVFVPATALEQLTRVRGLIKTASWYALGLVFLYLIIAVLAGFALAAPRGLSGTRGDAVEFLFAFAVPIAHVGASQSAITAVASVTVLTIVGILILKRVRNLRSVSGAAVAEAVVPPAILFALVITATTLFSDQLPLSILEPQLAAFAVPGSPVYESLSGRPELILLGLGTLAILVSGVVLSLPAAIAVAPSGDESLAGLTASVASVTLLVVVTVFEGGSLTLILLGVVSSAVIWELGEYSTVAAGELRIAGDSAESPAGVTTLLSIHAVVTLCLAAIGAVVVIALETVAVSATLPLTVALPAVLATILGLTALMLLLTG
jgi:hypothetical protein